VKKIAILPTLLTLGNAVCGFAAIALASRITPDDPETECWFFWSALLILGAMIFDGLDGYAARLSKTASDFGGQLDSLCDAISFGAAPAFLLLRMGRYWELAQIRQAIAVIAALYMVCAILRLARFNVENSPDPASHKRFKGLPSPGAAGCVAAIALLRGWLAPASGHISFIDREPILAGLKIWAPLGTLLVAMLMVSRVPYPHLTKQLLRGRRHFSHLVQIILAVCILVLFPEWAPLLIFWGYALFFLMRFALVRSLRPRPVPTPGLDKILHR
jgi:CDP-diacylglycerol--serine O-phosphatidyltransferase